MSGAYPVGGGGPARRPGLGRGLTAAIAAAVLIGVGWLLYVTAGSAIKPDTSGGSSLHALAVGRMAKLQTPREPSGFPSAGFVGPEGRLTRLADLRGNVVVLNLWATWCAPCVKEMPTLAKLQAAYAARPVKVVALSQDRPADAEAARAFIAARPPLAFYQDAKFAVVPEIQPPVQGFPTTLIYDRGGTLRATLAGEADWSSPEAHAVIDHLLAEAPAAALRQPG